MDDYFKTKKVIEPFLLRRTLTASSGKDLSPPLLIQPRLALNSCCSRLHLCRASIAHGHHGTQLKNSFLKCSLNYFLHSVIRLVAGTFNH